MIRRMKSTDFEQGHAGPLLKRPAGNLADRTAYMATVASRFQLPPKQGRGYFLKHALIGF
jgi:hypothetical protein